MFVGIRPDYVIQVRPDVLIETDGPTLRHAIQGLHGQYIILPRQREDRPSVDLLSARYERFVGAATGP
jgi:putative restriction endonuclease